MNPQVLNDIAAADPTGADPALELRRAVNGLKAAAFVDGRVRYTNLRGSAELAAFVRCAAGLRGYDPATLAGQARRLAFWINVYNALVIHAVIEFGVTGSVTGVRGFFRRAAYRVGGQRYSLDDIEHGVLRRNRPRHWLLPRPFGRRDPRRRAMVERLDPRIHFALVCGSRSCPPIAAYQSDDIDRQLELAAAGFINSETTIDRERGEVVLSRIFKWYGRDFGDRLQRLRFIAGYLDHADDRDYLLTHAGRLRLRYRDYDWSLNLA